MPGLAAKPIIDIDIVVTSPTVQAAITALTAPTDDSVNVAGYTYLGEQGIADRHALREPGLDGGGDEGGGEAGHTRNVYVCVEGCLALRNHLAIRDALRRDEALRREYEAVKWAAAKREWESVEGYVEAKTEVLVKVLQRSGGFGAEEVREVVRINTRGEGGDGGRAGGV